MSQTARLLVVDFDQTICDTPWPAEPGLHAWTQMVEAGQSKFLPVEGARDYIRERLRFHDVAILLTSRSESLRAVTASWINVHLPELAGAQLSMRMPGDTAPSTESKRSRLDSLRGKATVVLIDDDPDMQEALEPGDIFHWAPWAWLDVCGV